MKFVVSIIFIGIVVAFAYFAASKHKKSKKTPKHKPLIIASIVAAILLIVLFCVMYKTAMAPDTQCTTTHVTSLVPPATLKTAMDYFNQGNYDFETGNCLKAIRHYSRSIKLDPMYPQAYNNRAYTYMRLQDYSNALTDLNAAIALNPNYINARMNRGDIYNYYYRVSFDLAIADYQKVISLGGSANNKNVCSHLFMASHRGWNLRTIIDFPQLTSSCY